jgi:hypothetical protein
MKRVLTFVGVALAILGFYGPWVTSSCQIAALTYNALDLAEFAKFIVRAGIANITRELFLVPIVAAALALTLWINQPSPGSRALRYVLTGAAAIFSLVPLPSFSPPFSSFLLMAYRSAEDRGLFWLSVTGLIGVALMFEFGRRIVGRWRSVAFVALALIGAVPAALEFFVRALPAISTVNGSPAIVGWGLYLTVLGFVLMAAGG